ncbi:MAG TPA: LysM peptidoglycan-binding domain-containing protein [Actinomycetota bacterium]|nr:LysM peptidoglycan-binding domain-containing protein [Actinomycetota bacterium]
MLAILGALALAGLGDVSHTVIAGESLWTIAARYATTPQAIAAANHLGNPNVIPIGLSLEIPAAAPPPPVLVTHLVTAGENLTGIAARYGVSVPSLVSLNSIANPNIIPVGTVLRISSSSAPPAPLPPQGAGPPAPVVTRPATTQHVVTPGETLSGIAASYGVSVQTLTASNQLSDPNLLTSGESLTIPVPLPPESVAGLLVHYAQVYGVKPGLVEGLAWQESGWQQRVVSDVKAVGVMQLLPGTAAFVGTYLIGQPVDPAKLTDNIQAGVAFLSYLLKQAGGNTALAVAGYYQGLTSVMARGMYNDTKRYVADVLALEQQFSA